MLFVTRLGDGWVLTALTLAAAALLWRCWLRAGVYLLCAGSGAAVLSPLFKGLFQRARPDALMHLDQAGGYAFPSGHSLASATVYGAIAVVAVVCLPRARVPVVALCVLLVLAIGVSRVYLHVHYLSDVLAGWSLGAAWSVALGPLLLGRTESKAEPY